MNNNNSVNIYPKIKERFGTGLNPKLQEVYKYSS
jgi:hypothetical protein